jgi:hypothetical protein
MVCYSRWGDRLIYGYSVYYGFYLAVIIPFWFWARWTAGAPEPSSLRLR